MKIGWYGFSLVIPSVADLALCNVLGLWQDLGRVRRRRGGAPSTGAVVALWWKLWKRLCWSRGFPQPMEGSREEQVSTLWPMEESMQNKQVLLKNCSPWEDAETGEKCEEGRAAERSSYGLIITSHVPLAVWAGKGGREVGKEGVKVRFRGVGTRGGRVGRYFSFLFFFLSHNPTLIFTAN